MAVAIELGELLDGDFDLGLTGFDELELEKLLAGVKNEGLTEDDAVPEAPETTISQPGDERFRHHRRRRNSQQRF